MDDSRSGVEALLASIGERSLAAPEPVTGGWSSTAVWRLETAGGPRSLRVYDPCDAGVVRREVEIIEHAGAAGLPVARVHASGTDGPAPFMLLDWIDGHGMDHELLWRPWRAAALGEQFGLLQAALHRVCAPDGLAGALTWSAPEVVPHALRERMQAPDVRGDRLIHLDFHPANIIVADGRIAALIDWTNARAGDPRFDIARTYVIIRLLPGMSGLRRAAARRIVAALLRGWRRAYMRELGTLAAMPAFLAWAGYATLADMRVKPEATADTEAGRQLGLQLDSLERKVADWMDLAGLRVCQ